MVLTEEQKQALAEISALSGLQKAVIKEVWEFTLFYWAEILTKKLEVGVNSLVQLEVPFLGKVAVKYIDDTIGDNGMLSTNVESFVSLSPGFKKLVGDIVDEKDGVYAGMMQKKIDSALLTINISE